MGVVHWEIGVCSLFAHELECLSTVISVIHVVDALFWASERFDNMPGVPLVDSRDPGELSTSIIVRVCWCWRRDDHLGAQVEEGGTGPVEVCRVSLDNFGLIAGMLLLCQISPALWDLHPSVQT